jgi:hypothetical protein
MVRKLDALKARSTGRKERTVGKGTANKPRMPKGLYRATISLSYCGLTGSDARSGFLNTLPLEIRAGSVAVYLVVARQMSA